MTAINFSLINSSSMQATYSYLALGDSYTIGEGVSEKERFPYLTADILREQGIPVENPVYIAQTGWSTIALKNAIDDKEPLGTFDIVSLLIGVNDQYQRLDASGYGERFEQLLKKAIELAGNRQERVFVLSIPDYSATPFVEALQKERVSKEIDSFNTFNSQIAHKYKVAYLNITDSTKEAQYDSALLASDHLHYSKNEHIKWADRLASLIIRTLIDFN